MQKDFKFNQGNERGRRLIRDVILRKEIRFTLKRLIFNAVLVYLRFEEKILYEHRHFSGCAEEVFMAIILASYADALCMTSPKSVCVAG